MSVLSDALAAAASRIAEDFAHLQALLDAAIATDAADAAAIADLTAQRDALQADIDAAVAGLAAIDPDASFPPPPEPAPAEPPAEPAP